MFNECLIHLFDCTYLNVMCVCAQLYMDQTKKIFDHFICIWKWFLSLFVFIFSAYFVFHCLNMFYVEKQGSKFLATLASTEFWQLAQSRNASRKFIQKLSRLIRDSRKFSRLSSRLANREMPRNSFLKGLSWKTYFKPLSSSLKLLFQYFYIKTQPIWKFFHSINISKVILNSFHLFGSLDYILESFVLLVGIFIIGVGKT